ncbi:MAG: hypothetical protein JXR81_02120 [Candidatus Goldbacteria bacterium]|nr:hypothetical protein [Candidatus Goldiibacteriota bacterium]
MKKILITVSILIIASAFPLFAAAAKTVKAEVPAEVEITTLVEEASQADYPGVLVKGSVTGTDIFVQDLSLLGNSAIFEYLYDYRYNPEMDNTENYISGQAVFNTTYGTFGISVKPSVLYGMEGANFYIVAPMMYYDYMLYHVFGLSYANKIGDIPFGISAQYATEKNNYKNLNYSDSDANFNDMPMIIDYSNADIQDYSVQYMALKAGASLKIGLPVDVSVSLTQYNHLDSCEDWYNAYTYNGWSKRDSSKTNLNLSLRTDLGEGFFVIALLDWTKSNFTAHVKYPNNNDDYRIVFDNSKLALQALTGKTFELSKSFKVLVSSGLVMSGESAPLMYMEFFTNSGPGLGKFYISNDYENSSVFEIPFHLAVEGKLNETWSVNSGVNFTLVGLNGTKYDFQSAMFSPEPKITHLATEYDNVISPELSYSIGLSGVIGDLKLDMFLNPYILISGPNFISGQNSGNLNSGVAVSYLWK